MAPSEKKADSAKTLSDCATACIGDAACEYWMFNHTTTACTFYAIVKYAKEEDNAVVTGQKFCNGKCMFDPIRI